MSEVHDRVATLVTIFCVIQCSYSFIFFVLALCGGSFDSLDSRDGPPPNAYLFIGRIFFLLVNSFVAIASVVDFIAMRGSLTRNQRLFPVACVLLSFLFILGPDVVRYSLL